MKQTEFHIHLAYVGSDRFQLTLTPKNNKDWPMTEIMTAGDLKRAIRCMKPGTKCLRFVKITIDCNVPVEGLSGYFRKVYDSYARAKRDGRDLDAELRKIKDHPDPTRGSGGFSLN